MTLSIMSLSSEHRFAPLFFNPHTNSRVELELSISTLPLETQRLEETQLKTFGPQSWDQGKSPRLLSSARARSPGNPPASLVDR